jgi:hypothetical protein
MDGSPVGGARPVVSRRRVLRTATTAAAVAAGGRLAGGFGTTRRALASTIAVPSSALDRPTDRPTTRPAAAPGPSRIMTRRQWGAEEWRRRGPLAYDAPVTKLVVHHTATPGPLSDPADALRAIYRTQTAGAYVDLAYHWVIDPSGRVYEGRWARDYPAGVAPTGEDAVGRNVRGGATGGHNGGTIAVALLGDYMGQNPTPAMINALVEVLAWKCERWGIDPLGAGPYRNEYGLYEILPNIAGHRECKATLCPGDRVALAMPSIRQAVARRLAGKIAPSGYWAVAADGALGAFGRLPTLGASGPRAAVMDVRPHPSGRGVWALAADGGVFAFGGAPFFGSPVGWKLRAVLVGLAPTPSGKGYWLAGADGGVYAYGDAAYFGSPGDAQLRAPIVGITPTATGRGYWLVGADGGVFAYGDAKYHGSLGWARLNAPIVGLARKPNGKGYWLAAADGGVFTFGRARYHGSAGDRALPAAVTGIAPSPTGKGYSLLLADGRALAFGDAGRRGQALAGRGGQLVRHGVFV